MSASAHLFAISLKLQCSIEHLAPELAYRLRHALLLLARATDNKRADHGVPEPLGLLFPDAREGEQRALVRSGDARERLLGGVGSATRRWERGKWTHATAASEGDNVGLVDALDRGEDAREA